MTQQPAIVASDHSEAIPDEIHCSVALRRVLPVVAPNGFEAKDNPRDFQMARASTMAVERLEHSPRARQLLTREACVRWNCAAM